VGAVVGRRGVAIRVVHVVADRLHAQSFALALDAIEEVVLPDPGDSEPAATGRRFGIGDSLRVGSAGKHRAVVRTRYQY
jgi:hypothetical protein